MLVVLVVLAAACASSDSSDRPEQAQEVGSSTTAEVAPTATATATATSMPTPIPTPTATPIPEPPTTVSVATLNVLHGLFCPPETDWCDAPTRLEILWRHVEDAGCPEVVALQEISSRQAELIPEQLPGVCDGAYTTVLFEDMGWPDQEMLLTSLESTGDGFVDLAAFPWSAHWAMVEAPMGPVLVVATHFASSSNNPDCAPDFCPPELCEEGLETGSCNALQVLDLADTIGTDAVLQLVVGDLNKPLDHPRIEILTSAGFVDVWTAAGHPECDPVTGEGCTCCVDGPEPFEGLDVAEQTMGSRIDFVLVRGGTDCEPDSGAGRIAPFAATPLEEPLAGLYWASDHGGVFAEVAC